MNLEERNQLAVKNLPLVGYLVSDICRKAPHLSRDDLAAAIRDRGHHVMLYASPGPLMDRVHALGLDLTLSGSSARLSVAWAAGLLATGSMPRSSPGVRPSPEAVRAFLPSEQSPIMAGWDHRGHVDELTQRYDAEELMRVVEVRGKACRSAGDRMVDGGGRFTEG